MTDNDDLLDQGVIDAIAEAHAPVEIPPARSEALKARILANVRESRTASPPAVDADGFVTIPRAARDWSPYTPGVEICVLHDDEFRRTAMFRMSPGSFLFPHHHDMAEESLILEGSAIIDGGDQLHVGDYQYAPAGTAHPIIRSPLGCTVLVSGERAPQPRITVGLLGRLARYFLRSTPP